MTTNDIPPQLVLQQLIQGFQVTQGIYVAAKLGIADLLKDGPRSSEDLAQITATHAPSLYRILRLLSAVGILAEGDAHAFALTPLGRFLQTDVAGSLRNTVLFYGDTVLWQVWGTLLHSVETGEPSYEHVFGAKNWEYRAQHPETGLLFDLPHVVEGAPLLLEGAGVSGRCKVIAGDAFVQVPAGYQTYLLSRVLHDWDDERAIAILARCHQAMQPRGNVLLVERVIPSERTPEPLVLQADLHMLVATGGKERTEAEYRTLLTAAGFELTRIIPVLTGVLTVGLGLYAWTTKRNLSFLGPILFIGLLAVVVASIFSIFFATGPLSFIIALVSVGLFCGFIVYDIQRIKFTENTTSAAILLSW